MGGGKKRKEPVSGTKKELVITPRYVVTLDEVKKNERMKKLLLLFKYMEDQGGVYERSLAHLVYWLQSEKNVDMGYNFVVLGNNPVSRDLHEDVMALLYVGLLETDPRTHKLRLTSEGREFVEKMSVNEEFAQKLKEAVEELKPKVRALDAQLELASMLMRPQVPRRTVIRFGR